MVMWQRLAVTAGVVIAFSFLVGLIWVRVFGFELPSYLGGICGGLVAVPAWEFLQRFAPKEQEKSS